MGMGVSAGMRFSLQREVFLRPLAQVVNVVERRQTLPVLANLLVQVQDGRVSLTGTDLEVEMVARSAVDDAVDGETTIPARKLFEIVRALPDGSKVTVSQTGDKITVQAGRSRFTLASLPANDFPSIDEVEATERVEVPEAALKELIERTAFAMAQQDVRYYLNGMLLEVQSGLLRAVATDGHRLAMCSMEAAIENTERHQVIVPRKGILELARLLTEQDGEVAIVLGANHIRATTGEFTFTSKLVDGKFPDYERVLPRGGDKLVVGDRQLLREAFTRFAGEAAARVEARTARAETLEEALAGFEANIDQDVFGTQGELVITLELYTLAARRPEFREITSAWMARTRACLEPFVDDGTAALLDALNEGLVIQKALHLRPPMPDLAREGVARLAAGAQERPHRAD